MEDIADSTSQEKGKTIWSDVTLDELVNAIASLGDDVQRLKKETWRLTAKTNTSSSLWYQVISRCTRLKHNLQTRTSLYKIWLGNRHEIQQLVEKNNYHVIQIKFIIVTIILLQQKQVIKTCLRKYHYRYQSGQIHAPMKLTRLIRMLIKVQS